MLHNNFVRLCGQKVCKHTIFLHLFAVYDGVHGRMHMYVCMYARMHARMHACMYVCAHLYLLVKKLRRCAHVRVTVQQIGFVNLCLRMM